MKNIFQWNREYTLTDKEAPCEVCGKPTRLVEIFFEAPICSEECQKKIDADYRMWCSGAITPFEKGE